MKKAGKERQSRWIKLGYLTSDGSRLRDKEAEEERELEKQLENIVKSGNSEILAEFLTKAGEAKAKLWKEKGKFDSLKMNATNASLPFIGSTLFIGGSTFSSRKGTASSIGTSIVSLLFKSGAKIIKIFAHT